MTPEERKALTDMIRAEYTPKKRENTSKKELLDMIKKDYAKQRPKPDNKNELLDMIRKDYKPREKSVTLEHIQRVTPATNLPVLARNNPSYQVRRRANTLDVVFLPTDSQNHLVYIDNINSAQGIERILARSYIEGHNSHMAKIDIANRVRELKNKYPVDLPRPSMGKGKKALYLGLGAIQLSPDKASKWIRSSLAAGGASLGMLIGYFASAEPTLAFFHGLTGAGIGSVVGYLSPAILAALGASGEGINNARKRNRNKDTENKNRPIRARLEAIEQSIQNIPIEVIPLGEYFRGNENINNYRLNENCPYPRPMDTRHPDYGLARRAFNEALNTRLSSGLRRYYRAKV